VTQKLFTLPGETLVYPAHDYKGDFVSCIYQEKTKNPRLAGNTRDEFIEIMNNLNLPMPKLIDKAVPANLYCGIEEQEASQMASDNEFINPDKERRGVQGSINYAKQQIKQVDVEAAKNMISSADEPIIIDVREDNEYNLGHIENAINIPRGDILSKVETVLAARDKSAQVILYCASGNRSALAGIIMHELGYANIVSLKGGYINWKRSL
jgi:rhodanese-related sulfurtransferase